MDLSRAMKALAAAGLAAWAVLPARAADMDLDEGVKQTVQAELRQRDLSRYGYPLYRAIQKNAIPPCPGRDEIRHANEKIQADRSTGLYYWSLLARTPFYAKYQACEKLAAALVLTAAEKAKLDNAFAAGDAKTINGMRRRKEKMTSQALASFHARFADEIARYAPLQDFALARDFDARYQELAWQPARDARDAFYLAIARKKAGRAARGVKTGFDRTGPSVPPPVAAAGGPAVERRPQETHPSSRQETREPVEVLPPVSRAPLTPGEQEAQAFLRKLRDPQAYGADPVGHIRARLAKLKMPESEKKVLAQGWLMYAYPGARGKHLVAAGMKSLFPGSVANLDDAAN